MTSRPVAIAALLLVSLWTSRCRFDDSKLHAPPGGRSFAELCAGADVVFCDDFEDGLDPAWFGTEGETRVEEGAAVEGEGAQVVALPSWEGLPDSKLFLVVEPLEVAWLRFDVRYPAGFVGLDGALGPVMLGGSGEPPYGMTGNSGVRPDGTDFFLSQFRPGSAGGGASLLLEGAFANMSGSFPNSLVPDGEEPLPLELGRWQCVELGVRMNQPGADDGVVEYRVDGVGREPLSGIEWRTDGALAVDTVLFLSYDAGGGGPPEASPNVVQVDNVAVGGSPLGCLD